MERGIADIVRQENPTPPSGSIIAAMVPAPGARPVTSIDQERAAIRGTRFVGIYRAGPGDAAISGISRRSQIFLMRLWFSCIRNRRWWPVAPAWFIMKSRGAPNADVICSTAIHSYPDRHDAARDAYLRTIEKYARCRSPSPSPRCLAIGIESEGRLNCPGRAPRNI